jgi:hypothetical protein
MRTFQVVTATLLTLSFGHRAAADRWEADPDDGNAATHAFIAPGQSQNGRDLESLGTPPDQDWVVMELVARHSYEARAVGATIWGGSLGAKLERLDIGGTIVLQTGTGTGLAGGSGHTMRWVSSSLAINLLRVTGPPGVQGTAPYTLELFDTTYAVPRFNNSSTQTTIMVIHNNTATQVTAFLYFYNAGGGLLHTEPVVIGPFAVMVLNTSTIGALAGQSGAVNVAHSGGRDALSGKAVALEPATGFTFDTPMTPVLP